MAEIIDGPLKGVRGHIKGMTIYERNGKKLINTTHQDQPFRRSRKQMPIRERQSHNNALWRAIKETGKELFFKGKNTQYNTLLFYRSA